MKYLKIFEDFERSAYTKISTKTLSRGNQYLQEICPFLNIDLYEDVDVIPGGNFLYNDSEYDSIESLIDEVHKNALSIWDYRYHKYKINNGLLDVKERVNISFSRLTKIPYKFGQVDGFFWCNLNDLTTLEGAPHTVGEDFECKNNKLTTLKGGPHTVGGNFDCEINELTTLEGAPHSVEGSFTCERNQLITLKGAPHTVGRDFSCYGNQLTTLEGGPHTVGNIFDCSCNYLTTLKGGPHTVGGHFYCYVNQLTTLEGAPHTVGGIFGCNNNKLTNLKYLPKEIGGNIICYGNPNLIDFSDVPEDMKDKIQTVM